MTIYDASGRQVQRIDQNTPQGERVEHEIDPLPTGLYHIRVHGLSGQSYLSKIIVR
ncbi:MAG: T9SS type A sorting domain-containing protein [Bacteroidota bacterium]